MFGLLDANDIAVVAAFGFSPLFEVVEVILIVFLESFSPLFEVAEVVEAIAPARCPTTVAATSV